jgi:hypothetical protein
MNEREEFIAWWTLEQMACHDRGITEYTLDQRSVAHKAWQAARAKPVVPDGYVLLPVEPTEAIRDAMYTSGYEAADSLLNYTYKAMLAAAPKK